MADEQRDAAAESGEPPDASEADAAPRQEPGDQPSQGAGVTAEPGQRVLRRSRSDRVIAGVCGGLGQYLGVDAVLIRIATVILVFAGGAGLVLYVIGWIAIPEEPETAGAQESARAPVATSERTTGAVVLGLVFVVLGAFFLVDEIWSDVLSWKYVWPVALIVLGVAVILRARR